MAPLGPSATRRLVACSTLPWKGRVGARKSHVCDLRSLTRRTRASPSSVRRGGVNNTLVVGSRAPTTRVLERHRLRITRTMNDRIDSLENPLDVSADIVVPDTKHTIAFAREPSRTRLVTNSLRIVAMLRSIDLDDQSRRHTGKIGDVRSDRDLPAKVSSRDWYTAEVTPEPCFRIRRIQAKPTGRRAVELVDRAFAHCQCSPHPARLRSPAQGRGHFGGRPSPSRGGWEQAEPSCIMSHAAQISCD